MRIMITGSCGYIGSRLVPALVALGHKITAYDTGYFGWWPDASASVKLIKADIRDLESVREAARGNEVVIHLAAISNDPSCDLNPALARSVNLDAFAPLVTIARENGIRRFINASSASVYGVKNGDVTEERELDPITDYARYKAECEGILLTYRRPGFETVSLRPATVCGYAPRQRLDVVVNILTAQAVTDGRITVLGGKQMRPNIHIDDMCAAYIAMLEAPAEKIDGEVFNVGDDNYTVLDLADLVRKVVGKHVEIDVKPSIDERSYRLDSSKIRRVLDFRCRRSVEGAIAELAIAFRDGKLPNVTSAKYRNVDRLRKLCAT